MVFGHTLVNAVIKRTFFLHFCAGETLEASLWSAAVSRAKPGASAAMRPWVQGEHRLNIS